MLETIEIESALEQFDEDGEGRWYAWKYMDKNSPVQVEGVGTVEVVDSEGGGEGEGSYVCLVFRINDGVSTRYYKKEAYYESYDGVTWDGAFFEVEPVAKMVTVYERVAA